MIASGLRRLRFPSDLKQAFERETRADRVWLIRMSAIAAIGLYNTTLFGDYYLMRDVFWMLVGLKCLIITPVNIACSFLIRWIGKQSTLETMFALVVVLSFALPVATITFSHSPYRVLYQSATIYGFMYIGLVQRLRLKYTVMAVLAMLTSLLLETGSSDAFDSHSYISNLNYSGAGAALIVFASYGLERADRINYLWIKRGHILNDVVNRLASTDPLTGLWNRRYLGEVMEAAGKDTATTITSAILVDIDHFKAFNDFSGHLHGDTCLRAVCDTLKHAVAAASGVAARFGGEEILIFLPNTDARQAFRIAGEARLALHRLALPHPALGDGRIVTASFGVATVRRSDFCPNALISAQIHASTTPSAWGATGSARIATSRMGPTSASLQLPPDPRPKPGL